MDSFYSWAWTPYYVKEAEKAELGDSGLILPEWVEMNRLNPEQDAAIAHWSTIRDGQQYSWIWLFPDKKQAVKLRELTHVLPDDATRALIEGTIPKAPKGTPLLSYVQIIPRQWLLEDWQLTENGIHEVWFGFDSLRFKKAWELKASAQVFSVDEFLEHLKRGREF